MEGKPDAPCIVDVLVCCLLPAPSHRTMAFTHGMPNGFPEARDACLDSGMRIATRASRSLCPSFRPITFPLALREAISRALVAIHVPLVFGCAAPCCSASSILFFAVMSRTSAAHRTNTRCHIDSVARETVPQNEGFYLPGCHRRHLGRRQARRRPEEASVHRPRLRVRHRDGDCFRRPHVRPWCSLVPLDPVHLDQHHHLDQHDAPSPSSPVVDA